MKFYLSAGTLSQNGRETGRIQLNIQSPEVGGPQNPKRTRPRTKKTLTCGLVLDPEGRLPKPRPGRAQLGRPTCRWGQPGPVSVRRCAKSVGWRLSTCFWWETATTTCNRHATCHLESELRWSACYSTHSPKLPLGYIKGPPPLFNTHNKKAKQRSSLHFHIVLVLV